MAFGKISLKGRALRYLSGREHSRAELRRKLASFEEEPGQLDAVLDELAEKDFLSDARYVDSVLNRRAGRMGGARIRQELQQRGVAAEAVSEAVARLQSTEFERAREVWRRKFGQPPADAAERGRQGRFLMARGFSGDVVRRVLGSAAQDGGGDEAG
ncbi:recombination regulator RecX [Xylophilus rhododendri]|uniref:Regulatory protein RecX n=1 Tax=Xylophilus rhododendri TaxID=2697032 RepID=A0A857J4R2_9BURK|nr:recombination regulator RecX [Xylophilus rhododendri]QHI98954.1 recombination regulator RecX [Xylophilus rhododendri]